jgi:cation transport regulator ChaC
MPPLAPHDIWVFGYGSLMWRPGFPHVERAPATITGYHRALCIASTFHRGTRARPGLVLGLDRGGACTGVAYRVAAENAAAVLAYLRERELIYGVYRETWVTAELGCDGASDAHSSVALQVPTSTRAVALQVPTSTRAVALQVPTSTRAVALQVPTSTRAVALQVPTRHPGPHPRSLDRASDAHPHPRSLDRASDAHPHPRVTALTYTVERCHPSYTGRLPLAAQAMIVRGARGRSGANLDYLINTVRHLEALGIRERGLERLMSVAAGYTANGATEVPDRASVRSLCNTWSRGPTRLTRPPIGDQRRFGHRVRASAT